MTKHRARMRPIVLLLGLFITLFGIPTLSQAEDVLPPGLVIGDESGIYASSTGDYFVDLPEVMPGDVYTKEITIRSLDVEEPFELGLLVSEESATGSIDFNQHITLTLELDGTLLYQGPLLGDGSFDWRLQPLVLGTCSYGTDMILKATFEVSSDLSNADFQEASKLLYLWTFVATKNVTPPASSDSSDSTSSSSSSTSSSASNTVATSASSSGYVKPLPQTGEDIRNMMYKVLIGFLLILLVLLAWKKKKEE